MNPELRFLLVPDKRVLKPERHAEGWQVLGPVGINFRVFAEHVSRPGHDPEIVVGVQFEAHADFITLGRFFEQLVAADFGERRFLHFRIPKRDAVRRAGTEKIDRHARMYVHTVAAVETVVDFDGQRPVGRPERVDVGQVVHHRFFVFDALDRLTGPGVVFVVAVDFTAKTRSDRYGPDGYFQLNAGDKPGFYPVGELSDVETHFDAGHEFAEGFLGLNGLDDAEEGEEEGEFLHNKASFVRRKDKVLYEVAAFTRLPKAPFLSKFREFLPLKSFPFRICHKY